jgi:aerotaxis receptor
MRTNLPVSQREYDYSGAQMIVSTTDTKGFITHCNHAFVNISGYTREELIGQNHNMIRHPDVPAVAFKDLWSTIGRGRPWSGIVKNRRKDGDHYWVVANVTPILQDGKPVGYMSVRTKPTRAQIQAAEGLYAQINNAADAGKLPFFLRAGELRWKGLRGISGYVQHMEITTRLGLALGFMALIAMLPQLVDLQGMEQVLAQLGTLLIGGGLVLYWFHQRFALAIAEANRFANGLAGCNLTTEITRQFPPPLGILIRSLQQIQINLQAVVGDVRAEIATFTQSAAEIASGGMDLSARTETQASNLQETSSAMEQLSSTVAHTADTARQVATQSERSTEVATRGRTAVHQVSMAMQAISASSSQVRDIIGTIEGIAFQTNILALNAAVEAARAGEQGRGFAVVATEVRALAQRSAVAAKEIRELIANSANQIQQGTQEMDSAAQTIEEMVHSVREVGEMISQITRATGEQASGIAKVNGSVSALDSVTQQNAALVEESAASAEGLNISAVVLARSMEVFRLPR